MQIKTLSKLIVLILATAIQTSTFAEEHFRGERDHGFRGGWHGDMNHFHQYDIEIWRGGHWYHGFHDGRNAWWWFAGGIWYAYSAPVYPYPDPFIPPVVMVQTPQPPVYVEQTPSAQVVQQAPAPTGTQFWYYCTNPKGYYPYVPNCSVDWQKVPATPAPSN
jgi:hypothetical protein